MFWNKKNVAEVDGLPVVLSRRYVVTTWGVITKRFLAYREGDVWRGLVGYEEHKKEVGLINAKLDLILNHLNLEYVPETEKKEPAKLVELITDEEEDLFGTFDDLMGLDDCECEACYPLKPKKRKYVKSGKCSKKNK